MGVEIQAYLSNKLTENENAGRYERERILRDPGRIQLWHAVHSAAA